MVERVSIAMGNKVAIIDKNSPYFGKTGEVVDIRTVPVEMINRSSQVISSGKEYYFRVKLEDTETVVEFTLSRLKKVK